MAHPSHVEYTRFYNRYPYDAKIRAEDASEGRGVQRAGDPKLANDTLKTQSICELDTKFDPLRGSVLIGSGLDLSSTLTDYRLKYGIGCEADKIGISGCNYQQKHLFTDLPGRTFNASTWERYSSAAADQRKTGFASPSKPRLVLVSPMRQRGPPSQAPGQR